MKTIDWNRIWKNFDEWYSEKFDPDWEKQQRKIEMLVENELRKNGLDNRNPG